MSREKFKSLLNPVSGVIITIITFRGEQNRLGRLNALPGIKEVFGFPASTPRSDERGYGE